MWFSCCLCFNFYFIIFGVSFFCCFNAFFLPATENFMICNIWNKATNVYNGSATATKDEDQDVALVASVVHLWCGPAVPNVVGSRRHKIATQCKLHKTFVAHHYCLCSYCFCCCCSEWVLQTKWRCITPH